MRRLRRRELLRGLGLGLAWLLGLRPRALRAALPGSSPGMAALGALYLRGHPEEASADDLRRALGLPPGPVERVLAAQAADLDARRRADFRAGRTHELSGWTVAETELRLCALVYLEDRERRAPGSLVASSRRQAPPSSRIAQAARARGFRV